MYIHIRVVVPLIIRRMKKYVQLSSKVYFKNISKCLKVKMRYNKY